MDEALAAALPLQPHDPHLSKALWGGADSPKPKSNPKKRSLITTNHHQPSNKKPKIQFTDLDVEQFELYYKMLILQRKQCGMVLQELKRKEFNSQSSSSKKKQGEEKDMPQPLLLKATTEEDPGEQERDESEDERELNLLKIEQPLDGGIFNNEEINIVEDEELENKAADLSIACVEEKIENQQLVLPNSGDMDNVLPLQALLSDVKVEDDDGTKKTSSKKKKKKKKKKKDRKGTSCQVKTQQFGLTIQVLEEGDPNGKLACKGAKVKIHITAKVKDSEQLFESSIGEKPRIVNLDDEEMIEGLRTGIEGMRVGEKRRLTIPPSLGYGDEGCEGVIPPNSWLEYEVHLLGAAMPR